MVIADIVSVADLILQVTGFLAGLPDKWYKGNAEIQSFKSSLKDLSQRTGQWERQLKQHGMSEDPSLRDLLAEATKLLRAEEDEFLKHQNSRSWKWKRRLFPGELTYVLANVSRVVEAGPKLVADTVESSELLTKRFLAQPLPLPFGYDSKYVPIDATVAEVQSALENLDGPQVVTLYGEPGMGKSSLAKYVALKYQDSICGSTPCAFDSVQYIFCGRDCRANIQQLRRALFSTMGVGGIADANDERQGGDQNLSSYQSALRLLLGDRRMLIILDDVWREDFEVLTTLISRGNRSRYLVTSQTRDIWCDGEHIRMPRPTDTQARSILGSYMLESSSRRKAPSSAYRLEEEIGAITRKLECHPLSLVNVAVSMNRIGANDPSRWQSLGENLFTFLDQNYFKGRILVNERPYMLSVSASMMLMVETLPTSAERDLLFLIAMLPDNSGRGVPEALVKFFHKRLSHEPQSSSQSTFNYISALQHLEDNSLVEVRRPAVGPTSGDDSLTLDSGRLIIHNLRREYIRQGNLPSLQNMASRLIGSRADHHDRGLVTSRDSDESLALALGTVCFGDAFKLADEMADRFQRMVIRMQGGQAPRSLELHVDAREVFKGAKWSANQDLFDSIVVLLHLEGNERWKRQVEADASKMMTKFVYAKHMDDESMASLLAVHHIRGASLEILNNWIRQQICPETWEHAYYYGDQTPFSETHPKTWKALSNAWSEEWSNNLRRNRTSNSLRYRCLWKYIYSNIGRMLEFEPKNTILTVLQELLRLADHTGDPDVQKAVEYLFLQLHDTRLTSDMLTGAHQEHFASIIWKAVQNPHLYFEYEAMTYLYRDKGYVSTVLTFPIPCEEWLTNESCFRQLLRAEQRNGPLSLLGLLSGTTEFRTRAAQILKGEWWSEDFTEWPESYGDELARFWGNVALLPELHGTTSQRLVKFVDRWTAELHDSFGNGLCVCSCGDSDDRCSCSVRPRNAGEGFREVSRTVTIISHLQKLSATIIADLDSKFSFQDLLRSERWYKRWEATRCTTCRKEEWVFYSQLCLGRCIAYCQMGMHAEGLPYLDSVLQDCEAVQSDHEKLMFKCPSGWPFTPAVVADEARALLVFARALSKDYRGAMGSLQQGYQNLSDRRKEDEFVQFRVFADRAMLYSLCGEFSKAIHSFDVAFEHWEHLTSQRRYIKQDPRLHNLFKHRLLEHRGNAKRSMGDLEGSNLDMKSARDLKSRKQMMEPISWECLTCFPGAFRIWRMSEAGLNYSLLQIPADHH